MASRGFKLTVAKVCKKLHLKMQMKEEQLSVMHSVAEKHHHTFCVLPTGFGKSHIFGLLPSVCDEVNIKAQFYSGNNLITAHTASLFKICKGHTSSANVHFISYIQLYPDKAPHTCVVVSPLKALIQDQVERWTASGVSCLSMATSVTLHPEGEYHLYTYTKHYIT